MSAVYIMQDMVTSPCKFVLLIVDAYFTAVRFVQFSFGRWFCALTGQIIAANGVPNSVLLYVTFTINRFTPLDQLIRYSTRAFNSNIGLLREPGHRFRLLILVK